MSTVGVAGNGQKVVQPVHFSSSYYLLSYWSYIAIPAFNFHKFFSFFNQTKANKQNRSTYIKQTRKFEYASIIDGIQFVLLKNTCEEIL